MATSALEGKRRVYTLLQNAFTGTAVDVTWGAVRSPARSWALVGGVTYIDTGWAAIGARKRMETYEVALTLNVLTPAVDAQTVETMTLGYVDTVDDAFRADPTLGGLTAQGVELVPRSVKSQPTPDGAECQWEGVIRITGVRI
jgi:hypothetical protein